MAIRPCVLGVLLALSPAAAFAADPPASAPSAPPAASADAAQLAQAIQLMQARKLEDSIALLDRLIASIEQQHQGDARQIYSAETPTELVLYAGMGARDKKDTVVLGPEYGTAYFLKGFMLIDLSRPDEAGPFLKRAVALSPMNSQHLAELAEWHKARREWDAAFDLFKRAADAAPFSIEPMRQPYKARGMRGMGFVMIEQGKLDEAETMFNDCLTLNPNDGMAKNELAYIKQQRDRTRGPTI